MPLSPLTAGSDLLDRAAALAAAAGTPPKNAWSVEGDMLRSAWLFTGAAIDTYFHERTRRALTERPLSTVAKKYAIAPGDVDELIDGFLANRARSRPRVVLSNIVHVALLRETFQGSANIERAFALIGVRNCWTNLASAMKSETTSIKQRLNQQYARRNRIAHEGDYSRQKRPQNIWYERIERAPVDAEVVWTRGFLAASDGL